MTTDAQSWFAAVAHEHLLNELSSTSFTDFFVTPRELLTRMWHPHPLPSNLTFAQMASTWEMLATEEFVWLQILRGSRHVPKAYGFCGRFYAVEKVTSLDEVGVRTFGGKSLPWQARVRVALELLHLTKELSRSPLGALHHCDIQPANFGLTNASRAVGLDLDLVFTTDQVQGFVEQPACTEDSNCDFFDCVSACNKTSGFCSRTLLTNNLQVTSGEEDEDGRSPRS